MRDLTKLMGYLPILEKIKQSIEELENYDRDDGFGDMAQNFENSDRESLVEILISDIREEIEIVRNSK